MNTVLRGNGRLDLQQNRCSAVTAHVPSPRGELAAPRTASKEEQVTRAQHSHSIFQWPHCHLAQVAMLSDLFQSPATITLPKNKHSQFIFC